MSVFFETGGILTTVQDAGRNVWRRFGINPSGAMDARAARLVSVLAGNSENACALEMHFPAPILSFEENAVIALGGADFAAEINGKPIENWRRIFIEAGSRMSFPVRRCGARAYLAVAGGYKIDEWLGSGSTNLAASAGGFQGRALRKNDRLFFNSKAEIQNSKTGSRISQNLIPDYSSSPRVRVLPGAEWEILTTESRAEFSVREYTIGSESNRMGFRLRGEPLETRRKIEMISSAVDFGTIQLLPNGQLIVLMADAQTTGGYPRVGSVISADLPLLAQLNAGDRVSFQPVTIEEAEAAILKFESDLNWLKTAIRFL